MLLRGGDGRGERADIAEQAAQVLLVSFGRPADCGALRLAGNPHRSGGYAPISLSDRRRRVDPVGAVPTNSSPTEPERDLRQAFDKAWPACRCWACSWWVSAIAAWAGSAGDARWKPHPLPTDRINRQAGAPYRLLRPRNAGADRPGLADQGLTGAGPRRRPTSVAYGRSPFSGCAAVVLGS